MKQTLAVLQLCRGLRFCTLILHPLVLSVRTPSSQALCSLAGCSHLYPSEILPRPLPQFPLTQQRRSGSYSRLDLSSERQPPKIQHGTHPPMSPRHLSTFEMSL